MQKLLRSCFLIFLFAKGAVLQVNAQSYKQLSADFENSYQDAAKRYEIGSKLKKMYAKELAKDPMRLAEIDNSLGNYYFNNNRLDSAQACFARAVNGVYAVKTDTCFDYAFYLANMAITLKEMGYYEVSDKYFGVALPKLAYYLGASSEEYTAYVKQYVELKLDMGDYAMATTYNDALLYYYKTLKGGKDPTYRAAFNTKAMILQGQGNYAEAVEIFKQALQLSLDDEVPDTARITTGMNNLAYCYRLTGKNDEALSLFLKAYELESGCSTIGLQERASLLNNLAIVYKAKNDYSNAEKCFLKSLELYQRANYQQTIDYANPCNNLGDMYRVLGNYREAIKYVDIALQLRRTLAGEENEYYANALNNAGLLYFQFGQMEEAEQAFVRCEQIYAKILGKEHDRYAVILNQLSSLYAAKGDFAKALEYKNECLRLMEKTVGETDRYATFLSGKGSVETRMGKYDDAIVSYSKSAEIFKRNFGERDFNYIDMIHSLAYNYDRKGKIKEARTYHLKAMYGYRKVIRDNFAFMNDEEKTGFYYSLSNRFDEFRYFVLKRIQEEPKFKDDSLLKALFDVQLLSKSLLLSESGNLYKNMLRSNDTAVKSLFSKWYEQKLNLQEMYKLSKTELEQNQIDLNAEEQYKNDLEKQLMKSSSEFSKGSEEFTFEKLRKKLSASELAIEIVRNEYYEDNDTVAKITYSALLTGKDYTVPKVIILDSSGYFDGPFIEKYKRNIHAKTTDKLSYNRFFGALEKYMKGITKIWFSPDGVYQQLNLYTLYNDKTKKYLIEVLEVNQVNSLHDIFTDTQQMEAAPSAMLFGFPDYEWKKEEKAATQPENLLASRFGFTDLPELPGTKKETELISDVFSSKNWNTKLYLAKEATEEQVKACVNPTILHIATHGFFLPDMDYSDEKILGFETETARQNPLLRSGVIMAGAASKDTSIQRKDDGILTAYEASLLNLQRTELVTLSACETGLGDVVNGQGVYGLQRAFLTAGAKSVLMSLWVVDDYATQELMTNFYGEWLKDYSSGTKRSSFRKAQLEVKKRYPSPYYWGAFVMIGK